MHREPWIEQQRTGPSPLVAVLMHGRGRQPREMQDLAAAIGLGAARAIFPTATGATWYPDGFMAPLEANEPALSAAIAHYEEIVSGLMAEGVAPGHILIGGFSQGACLTAAFLARHPRPYAGALIFTGGLIGPPGTTWPVRHGLAGTPVYLTTSTIDEWVPTGRVEETAAWLGECGAAVTLRIFADRPHVVAAEEMADASRLVASMGAV